MVGHTAPPVSTLVHRFGPAEVDPVLERGTRKSGVVQVLTCIDGLFSSRAAV